MAMTAPDLKDPAQRAAYLNELRGVARPVRRAGLLLAVAGAALAAARSTAAPAIPGWLPMATVGVGLLLMITAVSARASYHRRRMRD
jgi:hypothetical protein